MEKDINKIEDLINESIKHFFGKPIDENLKQDMTFAIQNSCKSYFEQKGIQVEKHIKFIDSDKPGVIEMLPLSLYGYLLLSRIWVPENLITGNTEYTHEDGITYVFKNGQGYMRTKETIRSMVFKDFKFGGDILE